MNGIYELPNNMLPPAWLQLGVRARALTIKKVTSPGYPEPGADF
jgi:hypothetical protein